MTFRAPACRPSGPADALIAAVAAHGQAPRTVAVLLVRLGGYAAGVFAGSPAELIASRTGSRLVHGRSAAGGWSQHRFARRREKQAAEALDAAAGAAHRVFGPYQGELQAVVLGGDRRTAAALRGDPRLRPYLALVTDRFVTVPDPRLAVLRDSPRLFRAIRVRLTEAGLDGERHRGASRGVPGSHPPGPAQKSLGGTFRVPVDLSPCLHSLLRDSPRAAMGQGGRRGLIARVHVLTE